MSAAFIGVEPAKHVTDTVGTGEPVGGRGQACEQAFLAVAGRDLARDEVARLLEHGGDVRLRPGRRIELDTILDEVPVGLEVLDDAPQSPRPTEGPPLAQLHELGRAQPRSNVPVGVVQELVEQVLPALVERQLALQLVEHGEPGRQAGFDGELEEQSPGECVQGADRGMVERLGGGLPTGSDQCGAEAMTEIGCRLLSERDGGDRLDRLTVVDE